MILVLIILVIFLAVQFYRCRKVLKDSERRLDKYGYKIINLSYGKMTYIDSGDGEAVLSVHGIFGGFDQAYESCELFKTDYRVIAPSRFGYLGSDIYEYGSPEHQAEAYIELLDKLNIKKVFVLAASAGGTVAFRLALDYPERVKGLIFYSAAMPYDFKPDKYPEYAGPPAFMCNDYLMFLFKPMFKLMLGMDNKTVDSLLPLRERKAGVILDSKITNIDMARNYDNYNVESLKVPAIVFQSKDDRLSDYDKSLKGASRLPECIFVSFEDGGHLLKGHDREIGDAVKKFVSENS